MTDDLSPLLRYLARCHGTGNYRIPSLTKLSEELKTSISKLREQLEVARMLGLVEVRPKTGIRLTTYNFSPAVKQSLDYAIAINSNNFHAFSDLRNHIETAYWHQAVVVLSQDDIQYLQDLVDQATAKLKAQPIQIPHDEHREFHMSIYRKLTNPFVTGILETYWGEYEAIGLVLYTDLEYLTRVWHFHQEIINSIRSGNLDEGFQIYLDHLELLTHRVKQSNGQRFE
jgi:DNA-binding FadR family transcriptional regulator